MYYFVLKLLSCIELDYREDLMAAYVLIILFNELEIYDKMQGCAKHFIAALQYVSYVQ